jgi:hypothetical protein
MAEHGTARVLDVRRPKQDPQASRGDWAPGTLMSLGAALVLAFD